MGTRRASADGSRRLARAACLLALAVCACARSSEPPNLVIVTLDTTRADHLGLYGYFRDTSPTLDAFAKQAIVFDRAIVPMATTLPTHTSLFTGTHPLEHGVLANGLQGGSRFVPSPQLRTLAEVARAAGWRTAAFVSAVALVRGTGIETGFEHFDQPDGRQRVDAKTTRGGRALTPAEIGALQRMRSGEQTTQAALAWLSQESGEPFLLWVHYYDAHWPFTPPPPFATMFTSDAALDASLAAQRVPAIVYRPLSGEMEDPRETINLYDAELRYQDAQLAKLLAALAARPDWDRTAVVIAGDHGEGLGQHGDAGHGGTWDAQLHAPLVMRVPGEAPRRVETIITAADVIPTLLGRLAAPALAPLLAQSSGRDVFAGGAGSLPVLSQDTRGGHQSNEFRYALTTDRWKYFRVEEGQGGVRNELFDLKADPFELTDVAAQHPAVAEKLAAALQTMLELQKRRGIELHGGKPAATTPADAETLEQLRALGYLDEPSPRAP